MGAAASMKHVYTDGMQWFRTYFDRRSYNEDFQQLDTAGDGYNWSDGVDLGTERLSYQKFKMACLTFSSAQAHEQLTEEKIRQDFDFLDVDKNGTIEFTEVCKYCSQFFHKDFASQFQTEKTYKELRPQVNEGTHVHDKSLRYIRTVRVPTGSGAGVDAAGSGAGGDQTTDSGEGGTSITEETAAATRNLITASSKAHKAMDIIGEKIEQNAKIAAFQEIKISTEIMLGLSI